MNERTVTWLDRGVEAGLLLLAFLLPLACFFNAYDPGLLKDLTLMSAGSLTVGLFLFRQLEAGRFELPVPRTWLAAGAASLLVWILVSYGINPHKQASFFPAARLWLFIALFLAALLGPASSGFARRLAAWTAAAAGLAGAFAVLQVLGSAAHPWGPRFQGQALGTFEDPALLGVFLGCAFPLALGSAADADRSAAERGFFFAAAALCAGGTLLSGSQAGLLGFGAAALAFAVPALLYSKELAGRISGLASLGSVPAMLAAAFAASPGFETRLLGQWARWSGLSRAAWKMSAEHLWTGVGAGGFAVSFPAYHPSTTLAASGNAPLWSADNAVVQLAAELGLPGLVLTAALLLTMLALAARDIERRHRDGDARGGLLQSAQMGALLGLLAAGTMSGALHAACPGLLLWLLAGSAAGLALERGAAVVRVLPVPASPAARRLIGLPACAALLFALLWQPRFFAADIRLNSGVFQAERGLKDAALQELGTIPAWHPRGALARYLSGELLQGEGSRGSFRAALRSYQDAGRIFPHFRQLDLRKAVAYQALGEWESAERSLLAYASVDPDDAETFRRLAEVSSILGKPEQARISTLQLVRISPEDPKAWRLLGEQFHNAGRYKTARLMFSQAEHITALAKAKPRRSTDGT